MDNELLAVVQAALNGSGLHPHRLRGQNFLVSREITCKIASLGEDISLPRLEIGAGLASLSSVLAQRPGRLDLLEIEPLFVKRLEDIFGGRDDIHVHLADALLFDYNEAYGDTPYMIYGNIPYNITSPLLKRLLIDGGNWQRMVLMVQKEAALRLCRGKGKENGPLTLMLEYFGGGDICFDVPPQAFFPAPSVYSSVMLIKRKEGAAVSEAFHELFSFIDAAFSLRRKKMANSLSAAYPQYNKEYWQQLPLLPPY